MNIYTEFIERVKSGEPFKISFETKSLKVGKDWLVKDGKCVEEKEFGSLEIAENDYLTLIEHMYKLYKYSLPSERSESKYRKYFKALSMEELNDFDMVYGMEREIARAVLEGTILIMILNGWEWKEEYGKWFWQSTNDPDLIILRSWIEGR